MVFAIHRHELAKGTHVFPIQYPPPTSLPIQFPGSFQCTSPEHPVSYIEPGRVVCFTYDNIHVSVLCSQIIPPSPSPTESKRLFFTSVSLLLRLMVVGMSSIVQWLFHLYLFICWMTLKIEFWEKSILWIWIHCQKYELPTSPSMWLAISFFVVFWWSKLFNFNIVKLSNIFYSKTLVYPICLSQPKHIMHW